MEKLADKVQRSVAQRSLAADLEQASSSNAQTQHTTQQPALIQHPPQLPAPPPLLPQSVHNTVAQTDILSQASHDLLSQPPHDLMTQSPHDLLVQSPHGFLDPSPVSSSLLQSSSDPWDLL